VRRARRVQARASGPTLEPTSESTLIVVEDEDVRNAVKVIEAGESRRL